MSTSFTTKYGRFRVRHEPPTLGEAIIAAQGLTDEIGAQIDIAASLMNLTPEEVRPEVLKANGRHQSQIILPAQTRGGPGRSVPPRAVVVERRISRSVSRRAV